MEAWTFSGINILPLCLESPDNDKAGLQMQRIMIPIRRENNSMSGVYINFKREVELLLFRTRDTQVQRKLYITEASVEVPFSDS